MGWLWYQLIDQLLSFSCYKTLLLYQALKIHYLLILNILYISIYFCLDTQQPYEKGKWTAFILYISFLVDHLKCIATVVSTHPFTHTHHSYAGGRGYIYRNTHIVWMQHYIWRWWQACRKTYSGLLTLKNFKIPSLQSVSGLFFLS